MNKKEELSLNIIKTLLRLYEKQENLNIAAVVQNSKTNNKYFDQDGNINEI